MSQISSESDLDLDIDLESGGTTSEEDASKNQAFSCVNSKKLLGRVRSGLTRSKSLGECTSDEDCSCSYDEFMTSDEILAKNKEQLGRFAQFGHKKIDEEKPKKPNSTKPPRPPRGPSLDASDMKLLKEITELKSKRRRMERSGTSKKMKKEKASSQKTNLLACLVTVVFVLVIIFEESINSIIMLQYDFLYEISINLIEKEHSYLEHVLCLAQILHCFKRPSGFTNVMPHQLSSIVYVMPNHKEGGCHEKRCIHTANFLALAFSFLFFFFLFLWIPMCCVLHLQPQTFFFFGAFRSCITLVGDFSIFIIVEIGFKFFPALIDRGEDSCINLMGSTTKF